MVSKPAGSFEAVILDLDGVITRTAELHARAWKRAFDDFLADRPQAEGEDHRPFGIRAEYFELLDGKPRYDGIRSFLSTRSIELPEGTPQDTPRDDTIYGLGIRKNDAFHELLKSEGVEPYEDALKQIDRWREDGLKLAVVSSSRNGRRILDAASLTGAFDAIVDGGDLERLNLEGKPAADMFEEAARRLQVEPNRCAVIEDAAAGVAAGRAGEFGLVVGIDRDQHREELLEHGADVVVRDLREVRLHDGPHEDRTMPERRTTGWELIYADWNPDRQPLREALCTLGNGRLATRGAFEETTAGGPHYPGTYLAGGYNRLESEVAGRIIENEDLVNWPNWLPLTFRVKDDGRWFDLDDVDVLEFELRLDVYRGVLHRKVRFRDDEDRESTMSSRRFVHVRNPEIAAIEWSLTPHNWSGEIEIRSGIDGAVTNANVERYSNLENRHLEVLETGFLREDALFLTARTNQSHIRMSQAVRTCVFEDGREVAARRSRVQEKERIAHLLSADCTRGKTIRVEKIAAIVTSEDFAISEPILAAGKTVSRAGTFSELLETHELRWRHLWNHSDIALDGCEPETQFILRLHIFHLLQTISPNTIDRDVGVPARGWHGEAYRGHIFWDELFIFPYISLRIPALARSLLMYRYRRLPEARYLARDAGFEGAMFPWQSGSSGREESQTIHLNPRSGRWIPDDSNLQRHVSAAIAYNTWRYYEATGDIEFLAYYGAELILEIARFWASLARYGAERDRFEIRGVMGPDEFHTRYPDADEAGLDNNAYTNVMAVWVLRCACGVLDVIDHERRHNLRDDLSIGDEELARWGEISRKMFVPFHDDGIITQFEGYEKLEEFDWEGYREKYDDIHRLDRILEAEEDDVNRYKASKQADALMLFYLFSSEELSFLFDHMSYTFDPKTIPKNIKYYVERTSNGSTLSRIVHSWVLARSNREGAWTLFKEALHSDIDDIQGGTTSEGIHLGAMAGTVDLLQRAHTGLEMRDDVLWFNPLLPYDISDVRMRLRYRGHWLSVHLTVETLTVSFDRGWSESVQIGFRDEVHEMAQGESRSFPLA